MNFLKSHLASTVLAVLALSVHALWWYRLLARDAQRPAGTKRWPLSRLLVLTFGTVMVCVALASESGRVSRHVPGRVLFWASAVAIGWSLSSLVLFLAQAVEWLMVRWLFRRAVSRKPVVEASESHPNARQEAMDRRRLLQAARGLVYATPVVAVGYGALIERSMFRLEEVEVPIPGLPKELDGLRLVQITDLHMGPYLSERDMDQIVGMANETKAHLALMTGDLITRQGDPVDTCLRQLSEVKAEAGMIGCLGNHEGYAEAEDYVAREGLRRHGIRFLRKEHGVFEFRGAKLNFAGVDYQRMRSPYLAGAEKLIEPGMTNILLSHNPDVLPVAAAQGYDFMISGHTHGGQIRVEYLQQFVNPARFVTRFVAGFYKEGGKAGYVSRGLGTVGVPMRIGSPPELTLLRLRSVPA